MKLVITIETGNEAFNPDPAPECMKILRSVVDRMETTRFNPGDELYLYDANGNRVGLAKWTGRRASAKKGKV